MPRKHKHIGGIIGADPLPSGSLRPGVLNLGALGGDGASTTKPTRSWGGITGRSLVESAVAVTGVNTFHYWDATIAANYASISLTDNDQTATSSGGSGRSAFGDLVVTTGKWYYEVRGGDNSVGWSTEDEAHRVRYSSNGNFIYTDTGGTTTDTGYATYGTSSIIGCAWDADTGVATFYKDGVLQGSISGGSAGQEMRAKFNGTSSVSRSARINVGQDHTFAGAKTALATPYTDANGLGEFYHPPPTGYVGLYTPSTTTTTALPTTGVMSLAEHYQSKL